MARKQDIQVRGGEEHIGSVGAPVEVIDVTLVADTSIYADNDVLAVPQIVTNVARTLGGRVELVSAVLFDGDDQGTEVELFFTTNSGSVGTINGALNPTDAIADDIVGSVLFASADF